MSAAHLHLIISHVPVVGTFVLVSLFAWGWARRSDEVVFLGLWATLVVAAAGVLALLTGEPTERRVEDLPGFSHDMMEAHEDAAHLTMIAVGLAAAWAVGALVVRLRRSQMPRRVAPIALLLVTLSAAAMTWTAYLGGSIHHGEIEQAVRAPE